MAFVALGCSGVLNGGFLSWWHRKKMLLDRVCFYFAGWGFCMSFWGLKKKERPSHVVAALTQAHISDRGQRIEFQVISLVSQDSPRLHHKCNQIQR